MGSPPVLARPMSLPRSARRTAVLSAHPTATPQQASTAVPVRSDDRALSSPIPSQEPSMPARSHRVRALAVYTAVLLGVLAPLRDGARARYPPRKRPGCHLGHTFARLGRGGGVRPAGFARASSASRARDALTVEVPYITTAPKVLFMGDIRDNMDTYINFRRCPVVRQRRHHRLSRPAVARRRRCAGVSGVIRAFQVPPKNSTQM